MGFLSDFDMESGTADFRLLDRKVVDVLVGLQEQFVSGVENKIVV
jgi:hypothetical protein